MRVVSSTVSLAGVWGLKLPQSRGIIYLLEPIGAGGGADEATMWTDKRGKTQNTNTNMRNMYRRGHTIGHEQIFRL